jgi:hypothetical protein
LPGISVDRKIDFFVERHQRPQVEDGPEMGDPNQPSAQFILGEPPLETLANYEA